MSHQNEPVLAAFVAAASQVLLTLFGVDYYAMLWAFVGSLVALSQTGPSTRSRALVFVCLSTLVGAALGSAAFSYFDSKAKPILLLSSVVGGFGWQLIMTALVQAVVSRIKTVGGVPNEQPSQPSN